ncbi:hypothetical protein [Methylobacterium nigriterrae]|uniref:hypothetical protein n=1 Tax=Methylobacterium nigriterrae TaxID=3127512 RepID=UPI0030141B25
MTWTVEWSRTEERQAQEADGTPNIHLALEGKQEALQIAKSCLEAGHTVWAIKDEHGNLEMDRHAVFHFFYPLSS